jgi:DNA repair ATPase RecN
MARLGDSSMNSKVFEETQAKDDEISVEIGNAKERAKAYPDDREAGEAVSKLCFQAMKMWEACEKELRELDSASTDEAEKIKLVKEINIAHEMAKSYKDETAAAIRRNTQSGKVIKTLNSTGKAMKDVGQSMQKTGSALTKGCTIPILILVVIFFLMTTCTR